MTAVVLAGMVGMAIAIAVMAGYRAVERLSPIDPSPLYLQPPPSISIPSAFLLPSLPLQKLMQAHHDHDHEDGGERTKEEGDPEEEEDRRIWNPEDVAVDSLGRVYVGSSDGWILRICNNNDNYFRKWMFVGGRPLGLAFDAQDRLIVCEPSQGLLRVSEGKVELLTNEADGVKFKFTDAAVVSKDGSIYFTDASTKYNFENFLLDILESRPNGRLLKYDPSTGKTTVLLKDLYFANGIALSSSEEFLVFCETTLARCQRFWLQGDQKGASEIFIENLPAHPDNIKSDGKDTFWIGLVSVRSSSKNYLLRSPFLMKLLFVLGLPMHESHKSGWALAVSSDDGTPKALYGDPTASTIAFITTALPVGDCLYFGSLHADFVGRLKLNSTS